GINRVVQPPLPLESKRGRGMRAKVLGVQRTRKATKPPAQKDPRLINAGWSVLSCPVLSQLAIGCIRFSSIINEKRKDYHPPFLACLIWTELALCSIAEAPGGAAAGAVPVGRERRPSPGDGVAAEGLQGAVQGERQTRDKAGAFFFVKQAEEGRVRRGGAATKEAAASRWRLRAP
uniref:Uncharacterized protein n=1 Tax=Aegilops tauschii subsp. strangulata TaxID=200361 RepID=A0A453T5R2_AEGTS